MKAPVNSRYAHCDGITDIALYETDGVGKLLTCGADGDVRLWLGPEDQDPVVFSASDTCLAISCHKDTVYVGTENNCVESYSLPSGKSQGVITKFTAAVNHLDISKTGNTLVAGSGDMTFQIIKLDEQGASSAPPIKVEGHTAPVLSVVIDPLEEFVVSSGCDGAVCVWTLAGKQVKNWDGLFVSSNDIMTSQTLCRPSWNFSGKLLAIPHKDQVSLYSREGWQQKDILKSPNTTKILSVTKFSPCGKFLAAGCTEGTVLVWDIGTQDLIYENVDTKDHITGLIFSKSGKDIFAVDMKGRMVFVNNFNTSHETQKLNFDDELDGEDDTEVMHGAVANDAADADDPFGDDMDGIDFDENDAEGNEFSISKIKAETGFIASEKEDVFVGIHKAKKIAGIQEEVSNTGFDDDALSVSSFDSKLAAGPKSAVKAPQPIIMPFTKPQRPFQPSSSPVHLQHRFMLWNSIGIIRNYDVEDDDTDAIDIEFHDVSFHNAIHFRNQFDYTIAALGKEAAVFASQEQKDSNCKLMCLHFSSWDNNKEWSLDLPKGEEITGLATGIGWIAAATDINRIRIFSVGGVQKNIIEIGGQVIAIAGHEDLLFITFHNGIGLHGNQCVAYSILRVRSGTGIFPLISNESLPLSPKSELTWMGFTDEGTPSFSDSREVLRIFSGRMWTPFLHMKEMLSGESDHFWVTGVSVCSQHVRAIKCKGTPYPPALPRPTIMLLDAKIPLCEFETEKTKLEDTLLRSVMLSNLSKKMDKKGYDVEDYKDTAERNIKENLMKLFAMCCKGERDYRASEYVAMMPTTHSVQIAIKYASKLRKIALSDRLTAIGRKKLDEEEEGVEDDDDDFENLRVGNVIYSSTYTSVGCNKSTAGVSLSQDMFESSMNGSGIANSSSDLGIREENPLLSKQRAEIRSILSASVYKNPFKKGSLDAKSSSKTSNVPKNDSDDGKGIALIDAWKKPIEKPSLGFNPKHPKNKTVKKGAEKDKEKDGKAPSKSSKETKKQPTLFQMKGQITKENPTSPAEITTDNGCDSVDITEEANDSLNSEQTKILNSEIELEADLSTKNTTDKKRKRPEDEPESKPEDKEKKSRISSKFAAFAINRQDD